MDLSALTPLLRCFAFRRRKFLTRFVRDTMMKEDKGEVNQGHGMSFMIALSENVPNARWPCDESKLWNCKDAHGR
jgi:hypothetical protein